MNRMILRVLLAAVPPAVTACGQSWGKFWALPFSVTTTISAVTNFPVSGPFTLDFTTAIDSASISANTTIGSASCTGSVQVSLDNFSTCLSLKTPTLTNGDTRLTITPLPFLKPLFSYKVRVTTALKSYQGLNLSADFITDTYTTKDIGKWVFTTQFTSGQIHYTTLNQTTGTLGTISQTTNPTIAIPLAIDPNGRVLVSSNNAGTSLYYSSINQTTGVPSAGASYADVTFNRGFVYHPTLSTLYGAANNGTIRQYSINMGTGAPLSAAGLTLTGSAPSGIGLHPNGKYAYVSSSGNDQIYVVQLDSTNGSLVTVASQVNSGGVYPLLPLIEPNGNYLYSANNTAQTLSYYSINASTGALTHLGNIAVGSNPQGGAIDPTGRFVYIVNTTTPNGSVSVFSINGTTGAPTLSQTLIPSASEYPTFVAVEASGRFALVSFGANGNRIISYSIDQNTGALTEIDSKAATNAQGIAVY